MNPHAEKQKMMLSGAVDLEKFQQQKLLRKAQINTAMLNLATNLFQMHFIKVIDGTLTVQAFNILCLEAAKHHMSENVRVETELVKEMQNGETSNRPEDPLAK